MSTPTFRVYIDEAGDEGFSFSKGSSEWFVLSGIITRKVSDSETVKLVDSIKAQFNKSHTKPLHFCELSHEQRLPYLDSIGKAGLKAASILVHKLSVQEPETFRSRYRLYFYCVRYLLERISWYCRDHYLPRDSGDGSAEIFFSNRSSMSLQELKEYLKLLESKTDEIGVKIDWSTIKIDQIRAYPAHNLMGLQIADAVASGTFRAVNPTHGYTEARYVKMLKPVVYNYRGNYLGYGIKLWPKECEKLIGTSESLRWIDSDFK